MFLVCINGLLFKLAVRTFLNKINIILKNTY